MPDDEARRLADLHALALLDAPPDPLLDSIVRLGARLFDTEIALVSLVDADRQWFAARSGLDVPETARDVAFCAHAILSDDVFLVPDATVDERFSGNPLVTGEPNIRFYAGAPIHSLTGSRLGTVCVIDPSPRVFTARDQAALSDLATVVDGVIAHRAHSVTDDLTGLYNRRGFVPALERAVAVSARYRHPLSLALCDVDGLKGLNDQEGHLAGDEALRAVAGILSGSFRASELVARLGGDEFAVLFPATGLDEATKATVRVEQRIDLDGGIRVGLSIGCVEYRTGESPTELIHRVDAAMYRAKGARRAG